MNIYIDSKMGDECRRERLYEGSLFIFSPSENSLRLCQLASDLLTEAFHPFNPLKVHESLPAERCAEILGVVKPRFIHHPKAKECIRGMLQELGCDLSDLYFDVPRLRSAFPGDYLKSGIAYAFHPHRDTWYSAPLCQVNWWMPVYDLYPENAMAFHPQFWQRSVPNSSRDYNYYEWNRKNRMSAATHVKADTRPQPRASVEVALDPDVRVVANVGGPLLFSGAHLHSTVPNTTGVARFSIDFRTVSLGDLTKKRGAPNLDSACTGTSLADFLRGTDLTSLPDDVLALYYDGTEQNFVPSPSRAQ